MVTYFTQVCSSFLSKMKAKMSKAGLDQIHRQFGLESVQFLQALPMYASKHDFLGKLQQKQCVVLKSAAGSGTRSTCLCLGCICSSTHTAYAFSRHSSDHKACVLHCSVWTLYSCE